MVDLGPVQPLWEAIDAWRADLGRSAASQVAGAELREKLWLPIEQYLAGITTVLISPDGDLGKLPFAALPGKVPGRYLLEDYALAVVPAPQAIVLAPSDAPRDSSAGLLALGGVEYNRVAASVAAPKPSIQAVASRAARDEGASAFAPLPATLGELTTIQKLHRGRFGGQSQKVLQGAAATEQALLEEAPRSRYLHLATHGYFAAPRFQSALDRSAQDLRGAETFVSNQSLAGYHPGLLSGIALAGANQPSETDDGILTAVEVGTLNLSRCELVVLSACETGLGKTANGEGLLGLQRAFQIAGAQALVGSLWSVDDKATEMLMTEFYRNLWERKLSKIESLRQAQFTMLAQYDPATKTLQPRGLRPVTTDDAARANRLPAFYWAAFVLSGDWR
jgi:CHAT domain-containing protein